MPCPDGLDGRCGSETLFLFPLLRLVDGDSVCNRHRKLHYPRHRIRRASGLPVVSDFTVIDIYPRNPVEMDAKELIDAAGQLTLPQQKQVANWLIWHIDKIEHREAAEERYKTIVKTVEEVTNMRNDPKRKDNDSVFVRTLTVWRMIEEGYTQTDIAGAMGKDHSTVAYINGIRKTAKLIPAAYRAHLYSYDKLKLALNDDR